MSFSGMSRSFNPMWGFFFCQGEAVSGFAPNPSSLMSLRPAIPRRVALLQSSLPLHQSTAMVKHWPETVNHHSPGAGDFSIGEMGNFQLALTIGSWGFRWVR